MPFEVYRRPRTIPDRPTDPYVTITAAGVLSLSTAAHTIIGAPDHIRLLVDQPARILGIKASHGRDLNAYQLGRSGTQRVVTIKGALRHMEYDWSATARRWLFPAEPGWTPADGVLCLDLNGGHPVTSNRAGTGPRAAGVSEPDEPL
jgi:hypothetical protein